VKRRLVSISLGLLWIALVVGVVLAEASWFAHPSLRRGELASIEQHLVAALDEAAADGEVGCAGLMLLRGGEVVAEHGFGFADAATRAPVRLDETLFQIASVSKAVTAWGVMALVEQGRIGLDEPVLPHLVRWRFPGSEAQAGAVTVRQLLSHTAGLDDGLGYGGFLPGERVQTLEESLTRPADSTVGEPRAVRIAWTPGRAMAYSGGGYAVLQLLIEELTGQPFDEYMRATVLRPLGMTRSSFDLDTLVAEGRQAELAPSYDGALQPQPPRRYAAQAPVALYTTPRELARFAAAFVRENPVLSRATLDQMLQPQPGTAGTWGLGLELYVESDQGGRVVGHGGGSPPAWGAMVRVNPATGDGFVLVSSGASGGLNQLVHDWTWWETGQVSPEARLQIVQNRSVPAAVILLLGLALITVWRVLACRRARQHVRGAVPLGAA
jgi:CubicO group peptidase (beta-lactamase class C family)